MTSTTGSPLRLARGRLQAAAPRAAGCALAGIAVGVAVLAAGLAPGQAVAVAALAWALTLLVPPPAAPRTPSMAPALIAELRRTDAARILALELATDRLRSVLESLREGVVVVDIGGEVVLANPEFRQVLADPAAAPIGKVLWDVLAGELVAVAREVFAELDDESLGRDRPIRRMTIPFGRRVFDLTGVRVRSRQTGQDFGTVLLFVDTTRSHELAHLKDRFLSSISHELRTPLTNICAYSEILRHITPGETSEWPEFVRIVHEESLQLNRIVDTVFDYAQLESGEAVFHLVEADVGDIVRANCERYRERAVTRGLDLRCLVAPDLPKVAVDLARVDTAIGHLIDNALKFTPRDGSVLVRADAERGGVCLYIEDSGPGIPADQREHVFEKFNQLGDHLTAKAAGTGLGLATTQAIVTRLGGTIRCEPSGLGGAAFVIVLPQAQHAKAH